MLATAAILAGALPSMTTTGARSIALPFLPRPAALDGSSVGDFGFDPLGFATLESLPRLREAEVRHGRLAMVATWGWPVAELGFGIATRIVPPSSVCSGNGCSIDGPLGASALPLEAIRAAAFTYWGVLLLAAVAGELAARKRGAAGDLRGSFDPLQLAEDSSAQQVERLQLAELKHGRLAMCALAFFWGRKYLTESAYTFAHQLGGQTCVFNLKAGQVYTVYIYNSLSRSLSLSRSVSPSL